MASDSRGIHSEAPLPPPTRHRQTHTVTRGQARVCVCCHLQVHDGLEHGRLRGAHALAHGGGRGDAEGHVGGVHGVGRAVRDDLGLGDK